MTAPTAKFECKMTMSDSTPVYHYLRFDKELVRHFDFKGNLRRVVCTLNGVEKFNCALMPNKDTYIIAVNKQRRDNLGIDVGDTLLVMAYAGYLGFFTVPAGMGLLAIWLAAACILSLVWWIRRRRDAATGA